jgi:hypothetical protein
VPPLYQREEAEPQPNWRFHEIEDSVRRPLHTTSTSVGAQLPPSYLRREMSQSYCLATGLGHLLLVKAWKPQHWCV